MIAVTYSQCLTCGTIARHEGKPPTGFPACSDCGKSGLHAEWPSQELLELRQFILSLDEASPNFGAVASVFTCVLLESLLEKQVYAMALMDMDYSDTGMLADLLIEAHQGRARLLHLYKRLGYRSLSEDASIAGCSAFPADWEGLAHVRNAVIHGKPEEPKAVTSSLIQRALTDGLEVFKFAHNGYNSETHRYKAATQDIRNLNEDRQRLERWGRPLAGEADDV